MSDNRICFAQTLLAVFAGLILTSTAFSQGNSAPDAVDDFISENPDVFTALASDFLVNTTIISTQNEPSIAALDDGGFVIAWTDDSDTADDTSGFSIRAQRYNADGVPSGAEFIVNTTTNDYQRDPSVAGLRGGGFVIAWSDYSQSGGDTSSYAVRAQRYDAIGNSVGVEFLVNTTTASGQRNPSVAALDGGGFVIAWEDNSQTGGDTSFRSIRAQMYAANGVAVGSEFLVNTTTDSIQDTPSVGALSGGGFVIVWQDNSRIGGDLFGYGIRAQMFDASGTAVGSEFLVNTTTVSDQYQPSITALADGGFVIAWADNSRIGGDFSSWDVRVQLYDAAGTPAGPEFIGNMTTTSTQLQHGIAALPTSGFVIVWEDFSQIGGDTSEFGIRSLRYDASGQAIGAELVANTTTANNQRNPSVAALNGGGFAIVWEDNSQIGGDPSSSGIRARLYSTPIIADSSTLLGVLANDSDPNGDELTITHVESIAIVQSGVVGLSSGANVAMDGGRLEYDPRSAPFAIALPNGATADDTFAYTISDGSLSDSANVTVTVTGVNNSPTANADTIAMGEDSEALDVTATLLAGDGDPDTGENVLLTISGIETTGTLGQVIFNVGNVTYSPNGAFESLPLGQNGNDMFSYTIADPGGLTSTATVTVTINGANDAPSAAADALIFAEEEGARDVTANLLANDTDVDSGETAQLAITGVDTTLSLGRITLTNGIVTYDPNGAFNALSEGQSVTDRFNYTISDPHGATATATAEVTINGFNGYALTVIRTGLGAGAITSAPVGLNCGGGGACEALFTQNNLVSLSRFVAPESRFVGWGGDCESAGTGACIVNMTGDRAVSGRFELENPPAGRIVAATLPGARSGYVGGGDITVFMTVLSRQSTPAQSCRITAPNDPPFTISYRQVNAQNQVIGDANPLFDLGNGGAINFVVALTPTRVTDQSGYTFLPQIQCENANLSPIEGVNSVLVSIGSAPVPDILSIGATPSADGVVRIPETGNRISFLSAAAVNIGAGDGSAGAGEATVTASVDTGAASLPLTLEVCETASTGGCITPRGVDNVTTVFESNVAKYFAVFVRANGESTIPFDPANARVFLRFADANGTIRSATSAAVSAPAPAGDQPALQSAMPVGRWSVLVRQGDGEWPSLVRASLFVLEDGTAILDDGTDVTQLNFEGFFVDDDIGRFESEVSSGLWTEAGSIQAGPMLSDYPGDLWGVRDDRSDFAPGWDALAGQYGDGIHIASDGSINGTFGGCIVSGQPITGTDGASGLRVATVTLMSCDASGEYHAVMDIPANDQEPTLLISGTGGGWRIGRVQ